MSSQADVCVIGAGLAGALVAYELAQRGVEVVVLEAGPRFDPARRWLQMHRRVRFGERAWPVDEGRDVYTNGGALAYPLNEYRVKGVGGTTLHWTALMHRFHADDFRLRSRYGVAVDWPLAYGELEPHYARAEALLGVAGEADNPFASPRSGAFPLPAFPFSYGDGVLAPAFARRDIALHHAPFARNPVAQGGRPACQAIATCASYQICPIGAQYTADVHVALAERTGRARVEPEAVVRRLETDGAKRLTRAVYSRADGSEGEQRAGAFVLAAHAVESARLLLLSSSSRFPDGLANGSGAVGRYFCDHLVVYAGGNLRQSLLPYRIGFHTAETQQFCQRPERGERGGFRIAVPNGAGPTPVEIAVASGRWGQDLADEVRETFGRRASLHAFLEAVPEATNRVLLDPVARDRFGDPAPRIEYGVTEIERRTRADAIEVMSAVLDAAGAERIHGSLENEFNFCGHQIGTCRMGDDPETSVVDRDLRAHEVENLYVAGSAVFPTAGPLNPSLTIAALAVRLGQTLGR